MNQGQSPVENNLAKLETDISASSSIQSCYPTWLLAAPQAEKEIFASEFANISDLDPDLPSLEQHLRLLESFATIRERLQQTMPSREVTTEQLYQQLFQHYAAMATYGAQYHRLFADKHINPNVVTSMLDLGAGYWNSSLVYQKLFPNLTFALGLEIDIEKVTAYNDYCRDLLNLPPSKFFLQQADFFDWMTTQASTAFSMGRDSQKQFDLIVMQSFYPFVPRENSLYGYSAPDFKERNNYIALLSAIGELLTSEGKFILSIDKRDLDETATHLPWFCESLKSLGAQVNDDFRLGIDPRWGATVSLDVSFFVLSKDTLVHSSNRVSI